MYSLHILYMIRRAPRCKYHTTLLLGMNEQSPHAMHLPAIASSRFGASLRLDLLRASLHAKHGALPLFERTHEPVATASHEWALDSFQSSRQAPGSPVAACTRRMAHSQAVGLFSWRRFAGLGLIEGRRWFAPRVQAAAGACSHKCCKRACRGQLELPVWKM